MTTMAFADINETSTKDQDVSLQDLNDEEVIRRLPSIIYLAILIIIGLPGNISVLTIFSKYYKRSTYRTFVLVLAALDTVSCAVCMPFKIAEIRFQYTFYNEIACKIFRTNDGMISLSSICVLLALSVDRFRHVCQPLRIQMSVSYARIVCCVSIAIVIVISVPNLLFNGIRHAQLPNNITGFDCSLSDDYKDTTYPVYFNGLMFLLFIASIITLITLYAMIGRKIFVHSTRRKKLMTFKKSSCALETPANKASTSASDSNKTNMATQVADIQLQETSRIVENGSEKSSRNREGSKRENINSNKSFDDRKWKITKVAFAVTLLFILSYLPYLILSTMTYVKGGFIVEPGPLASGLLPIVNRSYFINSVGNPIIYGFIDDKFRGHLIDGLMRKQ